MKVSWWERLRAVLFGARRITRRCSRCGRVLDDGQKLPRRTTSVCFGVVDMAGPGEKPQLRCVGAIVGYG